MTKALANVATTQAFSVWLSRTNDLATAMSNEVLTANSVGGTVTGKSFVTGTLGANNIVATTITGGDLSTPTTLTINSAAQFNYGMTVFATTYLDVNDLSISDPSHTATVIDTFDATVYRGGEYTLIVTNTVNNTDYQISKILLLQDGTTAYITEYGVVNNAGSLGVFSTNISGSTAQLIFTPVISAFNIKGTKILTSI